MDSVILSMLSELNIYFPTIEYLNSVLGANPCWCRCLKSWDCPIITIHHTIIKLSTEALALFTKTRRIISAAELHRFSAFVCLHRTKQLRRKAPLVCNSYSKPALWIQKRCDSTRHDDDVCVFPLVSSY